MEGESFQTVFVTDGVRREELDLMSPLASRLRFRLSPSWPISAEPRTAVAIICKSAPISAEVLRSTAGLRVVHKLGMLVDNIDCDAARGQGIRILTAPLPSAVAVAEHTFCLILAVSRHLFQGHRAVIAGDRLPGIEPRRTSEVEYAYNWAGLPPSVPLHGKTIGLIGLGEIGVEVAQRARAFGMRILYHKRGRLAPSRERELGVEYRTLEELLPDVDILTLHVPHTEETARLLDAKRIRRLKPGAIVVNTARGGLVDEDALANALACGELSGAGLDAFDYEPLPCESPLMKLDNVVLTPHVAGAGVAAYQQFLGRVLNNLREAIDQNRA